MAERLFDSSVRFYAQTLEQEEDGPGARGRRASPARQGRRAAGARSEPAGLSAREAALASLAMAFGHLNLARMAVSPRLRDEILATGLKAAAAISAAAGRSST